MNDLINNVLERFEACKRGDWTKAAEIDATWVFVGFERKASVDAPYLSPTLAASTHQKSLQILSASMHSRTIAILEVFPFRLPNLECQVLPLEQLDRRVLVDYL
jgi:hypothetical protein